MSVAPQHLSPRPHRTMPQRLAIVVGLLLVVACLTAASGVGYVYWKTGRFPRAHVNLDPVVAPGGARNYLIIGSDSRANIDASDPNAGQLLGPEAPTGQRSDTILLVRVDPAAGDIKMLSFPRDLWVTIAGSSHKAKINSAYGQGKQVLIDTIRQTFGVEVNNYIDVDFKGFEKIVDALDGVNMYFPTAMKDDKTGLNIKQPGCVSLDGVQGLAYARSRYTQYKRANGSWSDTDPTSDFGRIKRQQLFVRRAMRKVSTLDITDVLTLNRLLDVATDSVTLDQTIDLGDLKALADRFKSVPDDQIKSYALTTTTGGSPDGQSIVNWNVKKSKPTLDIFRGIDSGPITEDQVTVDVRNGSAVKLQGRDVLAAFGSVGFTEGSVRPDTTSVQPTTTVQYAPGSGLAADLVARHLAAPSTLVVDPTLAPDRVVVTTATSFTTVGQKPRPPAPTTTTTSTSAPATTSPVSGPTTLPTTTTTTIDPYVPGNPPAGVTC